MKCSKYYKIASETCDRCLSTKNSYFYSEYENYFLNRKPSTCLKIASILILETVSQKFDTMFESWIKRD